VLRPALRCPWWAYVWSVRTTIKVGSDGRVPIGPSAAIPPWGVGLAFALFLRGLTMGATLDSLRELGFTAMWWAEGLPHYLAMKGSPPAQVLCLRSGEIGFLLDTKSLHLLHAGRLRATSGASVRA